MKQKCDTCGNWLEYVDTDNGYDIYICIECGREYKFKLVHTKEGLGYETEET